MRRKSIFHQAIIAIFILGPAQMAMAAPITFNTALPVAKEETVVRLQAKLLRSTDDSASTDRDLTVWAAPVVTAYGATEKLALFAILPVLDKKMELTTAAGRLKRGGSGLGDITAMARYTIWKRDSPGKTLRLAPFVSLKLPTGEDDDSDAAGRLPQTLQLGSGSWDYGTGLVFTRQTLARQIDASVSYQFNSEANNFEFGDVANLNLSYQHRVWPRKLTSGVPGFVYAVVESNLKWQDKNRNAGVFDENTGGLTWYLTPGIQYVTRRTVAEFAVQVPVVQNLNGTALENDFISTLSFRVNF